MTLRESFIQLTPNIADVHAVNFEKRQKPITFLNKLVFKRNTAAYIYLRAHIAGRTFRQFFLLLPLMLATLGCGKNISDKESNMLIVKNPPASVHVISSPLKGTLLKNGQPLAHTKIIRRLRWNSNEDGIEQEFTTDENGVFDLPAHEEMLELPALIEFVAKTDLYAMVDGERDQFWFSSKMTKEINSEWDEPPVGVQCDLINDLQRVEINDGLCGTKCIWTNMPKDE